MRIFISALLLGLFGHKPVSKCSTGEELTNSFIPAGLQVLSYYVTQIREMNDGIGSRRGITDSASVPVIEVAYTGSDDSTAAARRSIAKLEGLASVLDKEAREQVLRDCRGVTSEVMKQLEKTSRLTSAEQLLFILERIRGGDVVRSDTKSRIEGVLADLRDRNSELSKYLKRVKPLKYLSDLSVE